MGHKEGLFEILQQEWIKRYGDLDSNFYEGAFPLIDLVLKESDETVFLTDSSGTILYVSDSFEKLSGYSKSKVLGEKFRDTEIVKNDEELDLINQIAKNEGKTINNPIEFKLNSGETFTGAVSIYKIDMFGDTFYLSLTKNVDHIKRMSKKLSEKSEFNKKILERINDGYFECDLVGNLTFVNKKLLEIMNQTEKELKGLNYTEFTSDESAEKIYDVFNNVYTSGIPQIGEFEIIDSDNQIRNVDLSVSIKPNNGIQGFMGIVRDITEKKKLEEVVRLSERESAMQQIAAGSAHYVNNAFSFLLGKTEMMKLQLPPEIAHQFEQDFEQIFDLIGEASIFSRQLSDLSNPYSGKKSVKNINAYLKERFNFLRNTKSQITITEDYCLESLNCEINDVQFNDVLTNLVKNSSEAMQGTEKEIIITTKPKNFDNLFAKDFNLFQVDYIHITVQDNGCGMNEETRKHVFDPFYTTKEKGKGTGIGLNVVYKVVKNHGGIITVDSKIGKGTTFNIYIPITEKSEETYIKTTNSYKNGNETILFIDDDPNQRDIVGQQISYLGYNFLEAESGEKGLELYSQKNEQIDLVILDMVMKGMTGIETIPELQKINPEIKCIISTGYGENGYASTVKCAAFLGKPFTLDKLSTTLRTVLDKK